VGVETLVGRRGLVIRPLQPRGQVRVDGEIWEAEGGEPLAPGAEVVVTAVEGLRLRVEPSPRS
jgi:membrane-bound serine protease (ClpP class)